MNFRVMESFTSRGIRLLLRLLMRNARTRWETEIFAERNYSSASVFQFCPCLHDLGYLYTMINDNVPGRTFRLLN